MKHRLKHLFHFPSVHPVVLIFPSVLALLILQYLTLYTELNNLLCFVVISLAYILTVFLISLFSRRKAGKLRSFGELPDPLDHDVNAALYNEIKAPILACDLYGIICWGNRAFREIAAKMDNPPGWFSDVAGMGIDDVRKLLDDGQRCNVRLMDRTYSIDCILIGEGKNRLYLTTWYDRTDYENLRQVMKDNEALIAYIYIDNLSELSQIEKVNTNSASADAEKILYDWAAEMNGILVKYENEKYILFYEAAYLSKMIDNGFDILGRIREVRVGSSYLPLTISIGTSAVGQTFNEKNTNAYSALEFALAKGGDQAIVKTGEGSKIFGGMTKTSQKRSSVKSQTIARALSSYICNASNVLIMGHRTPDFDSIGSCVGMARLCQYLGTPCQIVIDRECSNITKCFGLLKDLPEYESMFISGDEGLQSIQLNTLMIICDVNNYRQFECPELPGLVGNVVYIDHHRMTEEFNTPPLLSYIEPSASSASELVSEILEQVNDRMLKPQEANLMYAGIVLDTKHFVINTGVRTFESARYLRSLGDPSETRELFKTGIDEIRRESRFPISDEPYRGHIMIVMSDYPDNNESDITLAAKTADKLLDIDGIDASFVILKLQNAFRISGRSSGNINVEKILQRLNGGGHFNAAAAQPKDINENTSIEEIKERLIRSIDIFLDQELIRDDSDSR